MKSKTSNSTLTLKNIYRLLTKEDYPLHSNAVVGKLQRRGLTLHAFWHDMLAKDLAITPQGENLWRVEGSRNRYLSDLFNRTGPLAFYTEYFDAVSSIIDPGLLMNIINRFFRFLEEADYNHEILGIRLVRFLELLRKEDVDVTPGVHSFLSESLWLRPQPNADHERIVFFDAYFLAVLALHAFFGLHMNNGPMGRLRGSAAMHPQQLLQVFRDRNRGAAFPAPALLTNQNSELCREPLPEAQFFGRDEALSHLQEELVRGGKILVSGMGGIGKTEMIRQVLARMRGKGVYTRIAYVQYSGSLQDSFVRSFLDLHGNTAEMRFQECLDRLNQATGRTLLLIDNMNTLRRDDAALDQLARLGCDVLITSRLASFSGFRVISLDLLSLPAAQQVFISHYGQALEGQEPELLEAILQQVLGLHPLLCGMIGDLARSKHWRIKQLSQALQEKGLSLQYMKEAEAVEVAAVLRALYQIQNLTREQGRLLMLFAALPYRPYPFSVCVELLADIHQDRDALADALSALSYTGWLENSADGFVMHPVIAEVLLQEKLLLKEYPRFWQLIDEKTDPKKYRQEAYTDIAYHALMKHRIATPEDCKLLLRIGVLQSERLLLESTKHAIQAAKAFADSLDPPNHALLFEIYSLQLLLLSLTGIQPEDEPILEEVLRLFPLSEGAEDRVLGIAFATIFSVIRSLPELSEALKQILFTHPWAGTEKVMFFNFAALYHSNFTKQFDEAIRYSQKALQEMQEQNLENSLEHMEALRCLATSYAVTGETTLAEEAITRLEEVSKKWYANGNPIDRGNMQTMLGIANYSKGDFEKAIAHYHKALEFARLTHAENTLILEQLMINLANAYYHLKKLDQAEEYAQKSYAIHKVLTPDNNLQTSLILNTLGSISRDAGNYPQALKQLSESREMAVQLSGRDGVSYAEPTFNLGLLHLQLGDNKQAEACIAEALPVFERVYSSGHMKTKRAREELAKLQSKKNP